MSCEENEDESETEIQCATTEQTPTVFVENSSHIQIGPHIQYHAPVTIKQYITTEQPGVQQLRDVKTQKIVYKEPKSTVKRLLKRKWLWIGLIVTLLCAGVAVGITLGLRSYFAVPGKNSQEMKLKLIPERTIKSVKEGSEVLLEAQVSAANMSSLKWYGPGCKEIDRSKYSSKGGRSVLLLRNVTKQDMGLYTLEVDDTHEMHFTLIVEGTEVIQKSNVVICYVAQWAHMREGQASFTIDDVDPNVCTHLIYSFAHINKTTFNVYSVNPQYDLEYNGTGAYRKMTSLKKKHPHLKVLLGVGGWDERDHNNYSAMAETHIKRFEFIKSVSKFLREYDFDGLDMHWQYPTEQHGVPADRENFVLLLKELREEFDRQKKGWILTTPLGVLPLTIERSYIFPEISKYLDYMLALCYAYHGYWDGRSGPNAPLYGLKPDDQHNINYSITTLIRLGAPPEKLVLGLPLYGRNFLLFHLEENNRFGGLSGGHGFQGRYVQEMDTWGYNEICRELIAENWNRYWDPTTRTPYISLGYKFMSYDNERSITEKVEYAVSKKLAGVSVWSLDQDDFHGHCAPKGRDEEEFRYPMMKTINRVFYSASLEFCHVKN